MFHIVVCYVYNLLYTCECVAGGALGNSVCFFTASFICSSSRERDADGIVLETTVTPEPSNFRTVTFQEHLEPLEWTKHTGRFVPEYPRARLTLSVGYFPFLIVAGQLNHLESQAGKAEVSSRLGCSFCRHVAERKTHFLSTGGQQDDMGGPFAISELVSRRLWCIRNCLVNIYVVSMAERCVPFILTGP